MRRSLPALIAATLLLVAVPGPAQGLPRTARITTEGLGKVRIGMSLRQVEQAAKKDIVLRGGASEGCTSGRIAKHVFGLFTDRRLAVIHIRTARYRTRSGIRRGDTEQQVLDAYPGEIRTTRHQYVPRGHYMTLDDGPRRVVFETDGEKVDSIRTGRKPEIRYVEGCA
jgi:hypothetical protein